MGDLKSSSKCFEEIRWKLKEIDEKLIKHLLGQK